MRKEGCEDFGLSQSQQSIERSRVKGIEFQCNFGEVLRIVIDGGSFLILIIYQVLVDVVGFYWEEGVMLLERVRKLTMEIREMGCYVIGGKFFILGILCF